MMESQNNTERPYSCTICHKSFRRKGHLRSHELTHSNEKPYSCPFCPRRFGVKSTLINHTRIHTGEKPYRCGDCNMVFRTNSNLRSHQVLHTGVKPFSCDSCNATFAHRSDLTRHYRIHTGEKPYICQKCGAKFSSIAGLRSHEETHLGKRDVYQCLQCQARYASKRGLRSHERIKHRQDKRFVCNHCGAKFGFKLELTVHERVHTGEKPYSCSHCAKQFASRSNMRSHEKRIHEKKCNRVSMSRDETMLNSDHTYYSQKSTNGSEITLTPEVLTNSSVNVVAQRVSPLNASSQTHNKDTLVAFKPNMYIYIDAKVNNASLNSQQYEYLNEEIKPVINEQVDVNLNCENNNNIDIEEIFNSCLEKMSVELEEQQLADDEQDRYVNLGSDVVNNKPGQKELSYLGRGVSQSHATCISKTMVPSHSSSNSKGMQFQCGLCKVQFSAMSALEMHNCVKPRPSPVCNAKSFVQTNLSNYNTIQPFKCKQNEATFTTKLSLSRPSDTQSDVTPYCCEHCGQTFHTKGNLRSHLIIHGSKEKTFGCAICGRNFLRKSELDSHQIVHTGVKPYSCDFSGNKFTTRSSLQKHDRIHTGEKPFVCTDCGARFRIERDMILHIRSQHQIKHSGPGSDEDNANDESLLKSDQETESIAVYFRCNLCNTKFSSKRSLKSHERNIHLQEKPYVCNTCGSRFNRRATLKIHERVHTGVKPYKCCLCDKKFASRSNMLDHEKRIHRKKSDNSFSDKYTTVCNNITMPSSTKSLNNHQPILCEIGSSIHQPKPYCNYPEMDHTYTAKPVLSLQKPNLSSLSENTLFETSLSGTNAIPIQDVCDTEQEEQVPYIPIDVELASVEIHDDQHGKHIKETKESFIDEKVDSVISAVNENNFEIDFDQLLNTSVDTSSEQRLIYEQQASDGKHIEYFGSDCRNVDGQNSREIDNGNSLLGVTRASKRRPGSHRNDNVSGRQYNCDFCRESFSEAQVFEMHTCRKCYSCSFCDAKFRRLDSLKCHELNHQTVRPFGCKQCHKSFCTRGTLRSHSVVHSDLKPFKCKDCDKSFRTKGNLKSHQVIHGSKRKTFRCTICSRTFLRRVELNAHQVVHTRQKPYSCNICGAKFTCRSSVRSHQRIHTGEKPFNCTHCTARFRAKHALNVHIRRHLGEKPFACSKCPARFTIRGSLRDHEVLHTGERPYSCSYCSKTFPRRSSLRVHETIHTAPNKYKCDICQSQFCLPTGLKYHKRTHIKDKLYECGQCKKRFSLQSSLKRHEGLHASIKPFACDVCDRKYHLKSSLTLHKHRHPNEKRFSCSQCDAKFYWKSDLKTHENIHINNELFTCLICENKFRSMQNLELHQGVNKGNKFYPCAQCSKTFNNKCSLRMHRADHRSINYSCSYCKAKFKVKHGKIIHERIHTGEKPFSCSLCCRKFRLKHHMKTHKCSGTVLNRNNDTISIMNNLNCDSSCSSERTIASKAPSMIVCAANSVIKETAESTISVQLDTLCSNASHPENKISQRTVNCIEMKPTMQTRIVGNFQKESGSPLTSQSKQNMCILVPVPPPSIITSTELSGGRLDSKTLYVFRSSKTRDASLSCLSRNNSSKISPCVNVQKFLIPSFATRPQLKLLPLASQAVVPSSGSAAEVSSVIQKTK